MSPQQDHSKPKRHNGHTGSSLEPVERQRIINLLGDGESVIGIARKLHHSQDIVRIVRDEEWVKVSERKQRLAAQAELNATLAAERMTDELRSGKQIPLNVLVPVFGVNVDKALACRGGGDGSLTIQHEHIHKLQVQHQYLVECLNAMNKRKPLPVLPAELVMETDQVAGKNAEQKEGV